MRNDLLLHKAFFRLRFLFLVCSLLASYEAKRTTFEELSQLQNHPISCKTASKDVLRSSENYLLENAVHGVRL